MFIKESNEFTEKIEKISMKDTIRNSFIAIPIISAFEIFMILRWIVYLTSPKTTGSYCNFYGYLFLLTTSLLTLLVVYVINKDFEKRYKWMGIAQLIYAILLVVWALWVTFVGSHFYSNFDYLVYVTIMMIVPTFCYLKPIPWTIIQLVSAGFMYFFASSSPKFGNFLINFTVFTIISIVAGWTMHHVRSSSYKKQIELEKERDATYKAAHYDTLTGLLNRLSFREKKLELQQKEDISNLIFAMFDVNGLKKINDSLGHDSGDELLLGATSCLIEAFSSMGDLYRVGGDEFMGIFFSTKEELNSAISNFERITSEWKGTTVPSLSVSVGTAIKCEHTDFSISELEMLADTEMYEAKNAYYQNMRKNK